MFPENPFSFEERADIVRMEFDVRSPKLRLSIFAYLIEAGVKPDEVNTIEAFVSLMHKVTEFVAEDVKGYADTVADLEPEKVITDTSDLIIPDKDGDDPYLQGGGGHL